MLVSFRDEIKEITTKRRSLKEWKRIKMGCMSLESVLSVKIRHTICLLLFCLQFYPRVKCYMRFLTNSFRDEIIISYKISHLKCKKQSKNLCLNIEQTYPGMNFLPEFNSTCKHPLSYNWYSCQINTTNFDMKKLSCGGNIASRIILWRVRNKKCGNSSKIKHQSTSGVYK